MRTEALSVTNAQCSGVKVIGWKVKEASLRSHLGFFKGSWDSFVLSVHVIEGTGHSSHACQLCLRL